MGHRFPIGRPFQAMDGMTCLDMLSSCMDGVATPAFPMREGQQRKYGSIREDGKGRAGQGGGRAVLPTIVSLAFSRSLGAFETFH